MKSHGAAVSFCGATEQGQSSGEKVNYSFSEVLKYQNVDSIFGLYRREPDVHLLQVEIHCYLRTSHLCYCRSSVYFQMHIDFLPVKTGNKALHSRFSGSRFADDIQVTTMYRTF